MKVGNLNDGWEINKGYNSLVMTSLQFQHQDWSSITSSKFSSCIWLWWLVRCMCSTENSIASTELYRCLKLYISSKMHLTISVYMYSNCMIKNALKWFSSIIKDTVIVIPSSQIYWQEFNLVGGSQWPLTKYIFGIRYGITRIFR